MRGKARRFTAAYGASAETHVIPEAWPLWVGYPSAVTAPTPQRLLLFAHGAGLGSGSAWMRAWAARLGALGRVVAFDYPYMAAGQRRPDPQAKLVAAHRAELGAARRDGERVVLVGKSMGSRMACHLALEEPVDALVCLGYPLVGQSGGVRDEVLVKLRTPVLFVQGTRDKLCPLEHLATVRERMSAPNALHVVETGDHSLVVTKKSGIAQATSDAAALDAIRAFLDVHAPVRVD